MIIPEEKYKDVLKQMLSRIAIQKADAAIIEIGASPLEPYNGDIAINAIRNYIKCTILAASDPMLCLGPKSF